MTSHAVQLRSQANARSAAPFQQLFREGVKMFSPPQMLFDRDAVQVIWDRNEHSMQVHPEPLPHACEQNTPIGCSHVVFART
eukprot:1541650-Rhodomonas_salina.4